MKITGIAALFTFLLGIAAGCSNTPAAKSADKNDMAARVNAENALLAALSHSLKLAGQPVRIYFHDDCLADEFGEMTLPMVNIAAPAKGQRGLEAVQYLFHNDPSVAISTDPSGMVRIKIGEVSTDILSTELPSIALSEDAQYNPGGPGSAIAAIINTEKFEAAMAKSKIDLASVFYITPEVEGSEQYPHLPTAIGNTTVEQSLDSIVETFPGAVVYGECVKPNGERLIDIEFAWLHEQYNQRYFGNPEGP